MAEGDKYNPIDPSDRVKAYGSGNGGSNDKKSMQLPGYFKRTGNWDWIGGYAPGTKETSSAFSEYLKGNRSSTEGIPNWMMSSDYGNEAKVISRMSYTDYMQDPNVKKFRKTLEGLASGKMEGLLRNIAADSARGAGTQQRVMTREAMNRGLAGGLSSPGLMAHLDAKMTSAMAGEMGDAYRQASLANVQIQQQAGAMLMSEKSTQMNLLQNIADTSLSSVGLNPASEKIEPFWKTLAQSMITSSAGGAAGEKFG